jgi:hypothetical protein
MSREGAETVRAEAELGVVDVIREKMIDKI